MKRIISILTILLLLVVSFEPFEIKAYESIPDSISLDSLNYSTLSASKEVKDSKDYEIKLKKFFMENYDKEIVKKSFRNLYNLFGDVEAFAVNFKDGGYAVININDLSIPEFSEDGEYPLTKEANLSLYNGPLQYLELTRSNELIMIQDESTIDTKGKTIEKNLIYHKAKTIASVGFDFGESLAAYVTGDVCNYSTRDLESSYYCGPDACAIILMYYDDHYDDTLVYNSWEPISDTDDEVQQALVNGGYIVNTATTLYPDIAYALNDWTSNYGNINYSTNSTALFNYNTYKNNISDNNPTVIGTFNSPIFGYHWVIGYGWQDVLDGSFVEYLLVNDGWGGFRTVKKDDLNPTSMIWLER